MYLQVIIIAHNFFPEIIESYSAIQFHQFNFFRGIFLNSSFLEIFHKW